ncbi:MAG TPA: aminoacyl-histidine dipeptidase [Bacteroidales bacterium]|nr:aminoacyl-histidine dipeptidase [Bacteroidales bacterium]
MMNLYPERVWKYFSEILEVPRLSKHEDEIIQYVEDFAAKHQLKFKKDSYGNCLISKPATKGFEDRPGVILQSHLDMVGEKLLSVDHDFSKDPIKASISDGWITAEGTTLGADDGIGIAASLAILESDNIDHGPLECLFTADEETGMSGAKGLDDGFMEGKILLNLDSEDEGEIFIGCAGGIDTIAAWKKEEKTNECYDKTYHVSIEGLQGGHSGDEIHKGFGNAIKIMNRLLWQLEKNFDIALSHFQGGKLRNAIPREASCCFLYKSDNKGDIKLTIEAYEKLINNEIGSIEPGFKINVVEKPKADKHFTASFQQKIIQTLYGLPHGVIGWSLEIPEMVETSTNLAVLKNTDDNNLQVITSQRSSVESAKTDIADRLEALFLLGGAEVRHTDPYPGWKPNPESPILKVSERIYQDLFNESPDVKAIHAGLECGLFLTKYPHLDMISFGPTIKGAHTPEERMHIESVKKFWDFLIALLKDIPR